VARFEVLVERVLDAQRVLAQLRASKPPRAGSGLLLEERTCRSTVLGRRDDLYELRFETGEEVRAVLERKRPYAVAAVHRAQPMPKRIVSATRRCMPAIRAPWPRPPPGCISMPYCWNDCAPRVC